MMTQKSDEGKIIDIFFKIIIAAIIITGIAVRIAVFIQNRNLFIDEANIARNIYERGFLQLATPLSYEQYAPPIFMWILKLFTSIFGYGEMAFRIYPLLCGVGALLVFYFLLREVISVRSLWYPLGLMAVSYLMIRYSTEIKQYMSDVFIVLSLLLLAIKIDIFRLSNRKFLLIWFLIGTLAIWSSMPSVFALAGVGTYYFFDALKRKNYRKLWVAVIASVLWLAQFAIYYLLILKPQISSTYLQEFHHNYFLFATPENKEEWKHNVDVIKELLEEAGGYFYYAYVFNSILLIGGIAAFICKQTLKSILFIVPFLLLLCAAALNQYSLIPRVALFSMPLMLLLVGYGFDSLMKLKIVAIPFAMLFIGAYFIYRHSMVSMAWNPIETEQLTDAMKFLKSHDINNGNQLYIHNGARPAFIYYTQMHPASDNWRNIRDAHLLYWDSSYDELSAKSTEYSAYVFTSVSSEEREGKKGVIEKHCNLLFKLEKPGCYAYIYLKK